MWAVEIARKLETLQPFSPLALNACETLSKRLLERSKRADWVSLGFWLRPSHITHLQERFQRKQSSNCLWTPRGLVFHIPPSNVEVMAIYSWIPSLLIGNANIIRLPGSISEELQELITDIIPSNTQFISYGHDDEITAEISQQADVRIIWGGDDTISHVRKIPLKPRAKELVFADRASLAVIHTKSYLKLPHDKQQRLAENFFNDTFMFDQLACSSPRAVCWVGTNSDKARTSFYKLLHEVIERKYRLGLGPLLDKMTHTYTAAIRAQEVNVYGNGLTVIQVEEVPEHHCGYGLIYDLSFTRLEDLAKHISKRHQTLTYFGIPSNELRSWAQSLNGQALDRIVPIGKALQFDTVWDGYDLLEELSSRIVVE